MFELVWALGEAHVVRSSSFSLFLLLPSFLFVLNIASDYDTDNERVGLAWPDGLTIFQYLVIYKRKKLPKTKQFWQSRFKILGQILNKPLSIGVRFIKFCQIWSHCRQQKSWCNILENYSAEGQMTECLFYAYKVVQFWIKHFLIIIRS